MESGLREHSTLEIFRTISLLHWDNNKSRKQTCERYNDTFFAMATELEEL